MTLRRRVACILLPFAAGYFLSYVFRTINALIAGTLVDELGLTSADLGFLTALYFLVMVAVQLPIGSLLDRYGPRRLQIVLLPVSALGAVVFALSGTFASLLLGRLLIGLGVSAALMAGLKAVMVWCPPDRVGFANGLLVTAGALGAITATVPAQILVDALGWRGLFVLLAALTAGAAVTIFIVVPERDTGLITTPTVHAVTLRSIFADARFWSLAPMSATCIGTSWALQGLWSAPWLTDVEGFDRATVVRHLLIMGLALGVSASALGAMADRLRQRGIPAETLLAATAAVFMVAQLALILRWPVPSYLSWALIASAGAATVLSYAILPGYFPQAASGRANAALNLLHLSVAFGVQWLTGVLIEHGSSTNGQHPTTAYQMAFSVNLAVQLVAFAWFAVSQGNGPVLESAGHIPLNLAASGAAPVVCAYRQAHRTWLSEVAAAQQHASAWRTAALVSITVCVVLTTLAVAGPLGLRSLGTLDAETGSGTMVGFTVMHFQP
jgi:predicted MFS family arabinose efflux permease